MLLGQPGPQAAGVPGHDQVYTMLVNTIIVQLAYAIAYAWQLA